MLQGELKGFLERDFDLGSGYYVTLVWHVGVPAFSGVLCSVVHRYKHSDFVEHFSDITTGAGFEEVFSLFSISSDIFRASSDKAMNSGQ